MTEEKNYYGPSFNDDLSITRISNGIDIMASLARNNMYNTPMASPVSTIAVHSRVYPKPNLPKVKRDPNIILPPHPSRFTNDPNFVVIHPPTNTAANTDRYTSPNQEFRSMDYRRTNMQVPYVNTYEPNTTKTQKKAKYLSVSTQTDQTGLKCSSNDGARLHEIEKEIRKCVMDLGKFSTKYRPNDFPRFRQLVKKTADILEASIVIIENNQIYSKQLNKQLEEQKLVKQQQQYQTQQRHKQQNQCTQTQHHTQTTKYTQTQQPPQQQYMQQHYNQNLQQNEEQRHKHYTHEHYPEQHFKQEQYNQDQQYKHKHNHQKQEFENQQQQHYEFSINTNKIPNDTNSCVAEKQSKCSKFQDEQSNNTSVAKACFHCKEVELPIYTADVFTKISELTKGYKQSDISITIACINSNLFNISIAVQNTGEMIGSVFCTKKGLNELHLNKMFNNFPIYFRMDPTTAPEKSKLTTDNS